LNARDRILLLKEAVEIETAAGLWSQKHVAAVTGYSVAFLRRSDCPRSYIEGNGPAGKERVVYVPGDVRDWMRRKLRKAS
jgi:hypothetical protein